MELQLSNGAFARGAWLIVSRPTNWRTSLTQLWKFSIFAVKLASSSLIQCPTT